MSFRPLRSISATLFIVIIYGVGLVMPTFAADQPTITISTLNLSRQIKHFALADGTWAIDPWEQGIGHLEQTGWFDNPTNIVLAGHSVMPNGKRGVFASLNTLTLGQDIVLFDGDANRHYRVTDIRIVPVDDVSVVMPTEHERLTLITCEVNSYDETSREYTQRLVIVADRVS